MSARPSARLGLVCVLLGGTIAFALPLGFRGGAVIGLAGYCVMLAGAVMILAAWLVRVADRTPPPPP